MCVPGGQRQIGSSQLWEAPSAAALPSYLLSSLAPLPPPASTPLSSCNLATSCVPPAPPCWPLGLHVKGTFLELLSCVHCPDHVLLGPWWILFVNCLLQAVGFLSVTRSSLIRAGSGCGLHVCPSPTDSSPGGSVWPDRCSRYEVTATRLIV